MNHVVLIYKPQGLTPLAAIERFRIRFPAYSTQTLGVAGRLDPMAEGLLVVLVGDENKKRKEYEQLPKTYEMDILFGFETDTYDELGIITQTADPTPVTKKIVQDALDKIPDVFDQPYPPFSSKPVHKKPLYYWAREGKLDMVDIPTKQIQLFSRSITKLYSITVSQLQTHTTTRIRNVTGDFRQSDILSIWNTILQQTTYKHFPVVHVSITCSSGTYMRGLAHHLGQAVGIPALAYTIQRTHIGPYSIDNAIAII